MAVLAYAGGWLNYRRPSQSRKLQGEMSRRPRRGHCSPPVTLPHQSLYLPPACPQACVYVGRRRRTLKADQVHACACDPTQGQCCDTASGCICRDLQVRATAGGNGTLAGYAPHKCDFVWFGRTISPRPSSAWVCELTPPLLPSSPRSSVTPSTAPPGCIAATSACSSSGLPAARRVRMTARRGFTCVMPAAGAGACMQARPSPRVPLCARMWGRSLAAGRRGGGGRCTASRCVGGRESVGTGEVVSSCQGPASPSGGGGTGWPAEPHRGSKGGCAPALALKQEPPPELTCP